MMEDQTGTIIRKGKTLDKHLLITVSNETSSLFGIRFLTSFFQNLDSFTLTLFYDEPEGSAAQHPKDSLQPGETRQETAGCELKTGQKVIDEIRNALCHSGLRPEQVRAKLANRQAGVVKDIIREGRAGLYDAVVLGRRGFNLLEDFFASSVTKRLLKEDIDFPIWVSKRPEKGLKNVLLCVDGSSASLRMADHVGFMLQEQAHEVTLLHVDTGHGKDIEAMLDQARQQLLANELPEKRIHAHVVKSHKVAKTILEQARQNRYAVVAVGRVGEKKGLLDGWWVGSISIELMEALEKSVLWISK